MLEMKVYKNYKELCKAMGWDTTGGNYMKARLKELNQLCEYHKDGNKFVVDEVYKIPKAKLSTGLLKGDVEVLILDLLSKNEGRHISITIKRLLKELEMVNNNYINGYDENGFYLKLNEITKVDSDIIADIFYLINNKGSRNIRSALKDLADKCLIIWEMKMMVYKQVAIYKRSVSGKIMLDENDKEIVENTIYKSDFVTNEEKEIILDIENKAMNEMNVKNKMFFSINKEAKSKFKARCKQLLKKHNIEYYYYVYDITYNSEQVLKALNRGDLAEIRNRLNSNMINQMSKTIEDRKEQNKVRLGDADGFAEIYKDKLNDIDILVNKNNYEKDAKKVAKKIIDRKIKSEFLIKQ